MTSDATMATDLLVPCLRALRQQGVELERQATEDGERILREVGLDLSRLGDPAVRIPHSSGLRLLDNALRLSGQPDFALGAGAGMLPGEMGVSDLASATAPNLGESMRLAAHYLPLLHDGASIELIDAGELVVWRHRMHPGLLRSSAVNEYVMAAYCVRVRELVGLGRPPLEVRFAHPEPRHWACYEGIFRTTLHFNWDANEMLIPKAAMDLPLKESNAQLHAVLCRHADELLDRLPTSRPFMRRVRELVRKRLDSGASLGCVASLLHMSESTVQRRLQAEGISYKQLADDVRRELALELLTNRELNISQVAFRLGFSHRPAFHRAFNRWYGLSPSQHRERLGANPCLC